MTVPIDRVETRILSIRGHRVMVDTGEKMELVAKCDRWRRREEVNSEYRVTCDIENAYDGDKEKGAKIMKFLVEVEQEVDGRWLAEVMEIPGVMSYGKTPEEAKLRVQALALRVIADRIENGEAGTDLATIAFEAA